MVDRKYQKRTRMQAPDHLMAAEVRAELDWDPALNASRIQVEVKDGRVTLRGAVNTFADVERAGGDAWAIRAVRAVDNELQVGLRGGLVADVDITRDCREAVLADPVAPDQGIMALVIDGWVTLTGEVCFHHQRQAAERAVAPVIGVLGVSNKVALATDHIISADTAVHIQTALQRKAILASSAIEVSTGGDVVYLDGSVPTWAAMQVAVDTAWCAPGVTQVVARLSIVP
jgi:osmotically-inducible protein OsmY